MLRFLPGLLGGVALFVGLLGCTSNEPDIVVEEREGVPHIINRGEKVWDDFESAPIQLKHEQTYGAKEEPQDAILARIGGMAVGDDGTLYVLDPGNHRLVAFNPDGRVEWTAGRQGKGPGEFQRPSALVLGNNRLYVENQRGQQIEVWTSEGEFLERHSFENTEGSGRHFVGFTNDHLILSRTGFKNDPQKIQALNPESWQVSHSFQPDLSLNRPVDFFISAEATVIGERIFVSGITEYTLSEYAIDGSLLRRTLRKTDFLMTPGSVETERGRVIRSYSQLHAPVHLHSGHLLVEAMWATNVSKPDAHLRRSRNNVAEEPVYAVTLDLFRKGGRYAGTLRWNDERPPPFPPIGHLRTVGPNGKLYTIKYEPFPQIRRYDVTVEDE